jgi:hypothetical protein
VLVEPDRQVLFQVVQLPIREAEEQEAIIAELLLLLVAQAAAVQVP